MDENLFLRRLFRGWRGAIIVFFLLMILLITWRLLTRGWSGDLLFVADVVDKVILIVGIAFLLHFVTSSYERSELELLIRSLFVEESKRVRDLFAAEIQNTQLGIEHTYAKREEAVEHVLSRIAEAKERVWIAAVGMYADVELHKVLERIPESLGDDAVRILLLFGVTETAVLRAVFDESDLDNKIELIEALKDAPRAAAAFKATLIYRRYEEARNLAAKSKRKECFKFYDPQPPCWLVVVDNCAFYEPYTLASAETACAGADMPVMRLNKTQGRNLFRIVENHHKNLWAGSDITVGDAVKRKTDYRVDFDALRLTIQHKLKGLHDLALEDKAASQIRT